MLDARVKRDVPVMVVIGNPPWRQQAKGSAPWLERARDPSKPLDAATRPSLDEFRMPGQGRREFNLNNMWTYFWRWATWKAFEANDPAGVVALITPSAYLTSPSHAGMRRYLREIADEGWIIDLSPEHHRSNTSTRVFPETQHPICIGIFVRLGQPRPHVPARVHYTQLFGSQQQKFDLLAKLRPQSSGWRQCPDGWVSALRPGDARWESYPLLGDLLPWQHTGVASNRNWVWAPDSDTLQRRWQMLIHADANEKRSLFKETDSRKISRRYPPHAGLSSGEVPFETETSDYPPMVRVAFRSFDRQYLIFDRRVIDRPRPELWQVQGDRQIYTCEQHAHVFKEGTALVFSALVSNVDCFNNRGGRVLPLFRNAETAAPNSPPRLLPSLSRLLGRQIDAEELLAYIAAVVAHSGYTSKFREQLNTPGIRVPITMDVELFNRATAIGCEVLWLHTFGERFADEAKGRAPGPPTLPPVKRPRYVEPVPAGEGGLPGKVQYEQKTQTIVIGEDTLFSTAGRVHPVPPAVWAYKVGGMEVVKQWFSYRQPAPRYRRRTSELDSINPDRWTSEFDDELLELLTVLRRCVELEPKQAKLLDQICDAPLVSVTGLEQKNAMPPPPAFRKPPRHASTKPLPQLPPE